MITLDQLAAAFSAGFLTSLMPCVYPMIPIIVGIFAGRDRTSPWRGLGLGVLYVLGMGTTFAILGVASALSGQLMGQVMASPWFVAPIVAIYAALALSMFGVFELRLPAAWQARLSRVGGRGATGAFALGAVGGLTAAPCTGPWLLGILGLIARHRDVAGGAVLLFTYALGMGVLVIALAVCSISLPRSGRWMEAVKTISGVALLVMGVYFVRPLAGGLGAAVPPAAWFVVIAIAVAGAGAGLALVGVPGRTRRGLGIAALTAGAAAAMLWWLTPTRTIAWRTDEAAAFAEARAQRRPMIVDFGAEWCAPCKLYETRVFADPSVHARIGARFVPLRFDVTTADDAALAAQERWSAGALPTVIVLDERGREVRRFGKDIPSPEQFLAALTAATPARRPP